MKKNGTFTMIVIFIVFIGITAERAIAAGTEEKFPRRPVEVILPVAPGGGTDLTMRVITEAVEPFLGQKMVLIYKPGAGGIVGTAAVAKSKPDGYTLGVVWWSLLSVSPHIEDAGYKLEDFTYITQLMESTTLFCVHSDFPAKDWKEFFEYARQHPDQITCANDGIGGAIHVKAERIFKAMGVRLRPVPFHGAGEMSKALLGKHVDMYSGSISPMMPHIKAGTVRALFGSALGDVPEIPGAVGLAKMGHPEVASLNWRGVIAPRGLPEERRMILEKALHKTAQTDLVRNRLKQWSDRVVVSSSSKEFEEMVRLEYKAYGNVLKELGMLKK